MNPFVPRLKRVEATLWQVHISVHGGGWRHLGAQWRSIGACCHCLEGWLLASQLGTYVLGHSARGLDSGCSEDYHPCQKAKSCRLVASGHHCFRSVGDGILPFIGSLAHCPCSDEALSSPLSPLHMHSPSPSATADTHPSPASLLIVFGCSGGFILASVGQIQGWWVDERSNMGYECRMVTEGRKIVSAWLHAVPLFFFVSCHFLLSFFHGF